MYPEHLKYTREHEWLRVDGDTVRLGITDFAQDALGDIVFVTLPEAGASVSAGQSLGEVESTKSVSDIYTPVTGEVVGRNEALQDQPELINSDPYGEGWIVEVRLTEPLANEGLLDAAGYEAMVKES